MVHGRYGGPVLPSGFHAKIGTVLVVEDDADLRESLVELLERQGVRVETAVDGADAITLLDEIDPPAAILVDLMMPGIVGHELLEYLDTDDRLGQIPVAVMTGSPHLAPAGYPLFEKPLDVQSLLDFVKSSCALFSPSSQRRSPSSRPGESKGIRRAR